MADDLATTIKDTVQAAFGAVQNGLTGGRHVIRNQGLLDLTGATEPGDLEHIDGLENIGLILVPEPLVPALTRIRMEGVGATVPVPVGGRVRTYTGQVKLAGDTFAGDQLADDIIVLAGQVVFTSPVTRINARGVIVAGQVLVPKASAAVLATAITRCAGQVVPYPDGARPRIAVGRDEFAHGFFDFLPEPVVLILVGSFDVADDVTVDDLRDKLAGLVVVGTMTCSASLRPALQARCDECIGAIRAREAVAD